MIYALLVDNETDRFKDEIKLALNRKFSINGKVVHHLRKQIINEIIIQYVVELDRF